MIDTLTKQAYESFLIEGSIYHVQSENEEVDIDNSEVIVTDCDGTDVSATLLDLPTKTYGNDPKGGVHNTLKIRRRGGEAAYSPYLITFRIQTTLENKWEIDRILTVKEVE